MRIIAIDPGVERVGIAILEKISGGKETVLYSDCFKTSAKIAHSERLTLIGEELTTIIKQWKPSALSIEKLFFETNTKTAMSVAEARGVMLYVAGQNSLTVYEYTPLQIKVAVTGYGKSDKTAVMTMVPRLVTLGAKKEGKKIGDDEMDAIAIGLTCFASEHFSTKILA
jgi:crossover junction endodeoxyribonuclease RuvC